MRIPVAVESIDRWKGPGPWCTQVSILFGVGSLIVTTIAVPALLPKMKNSRRRSQGAARMATSA
jgi:hypothetical protein